MVHYGERRPYYSFGVLYHYRDESIRATNRKTMLFGAAKLISLAVNITLYLLTVAGTE